MTKPLTAYQGIPGSFSYLAMTSYFNSHVTGFGKSRFRDIFKSVENKETNFAIVPVENSLAGSIYEIFDLLWEYNYSAIGEYYLRVKHNLLSTNSDLNKIKKVYSHPKALEQCTNFFEKNPHIEKINFSDTAGAAKYVADSKDESLAAIASYEAAELYGLNTLAEKLEDDPNNFTRFLILSPQALNQEKANKCSIIFTLPHLPQSLLKAMQTISDNKINITKIESRPIQGKPFEYVFYIDFEFKPEDLIYAQERMKEFQARANALKILGYYPKGSLI